MKKLRRALFVFALTAGIFVMGHTNSVLAEEEAKVVSTQMTLSSGNSVSSMTDNSYYSCSYVSAGDTLTITSETPMDGIYIKWDAIPKSTGTVSYNDKQMEYGANGFLHEYLSLDEETTSVTIKFTDAEQICNIEAYSKGILPKEVQVWEPSCENADILVFSTHSDDEILFLGGVLTTYGGEQDLAVQVAYMCTYAGTDSKIREHEKLDGIWTSGIENYPVCGDYPDLYSKELEVAETQYSLDALTTTAVTYMRQFKPLVVVSQDFNGEYGHGGHKVWAKAIAQALELSNDETYDEASAKKYGTWDVPKAYYHLYNQNVITLDLHQPLSHFDGKDSIEVQKEAYLKHVSQQWCSFAIIDDANDAKYDRYNCLQFGLYRSTVGADTGNDMLENVTTYEEKARLEEIARQEEEEKNNSTEIQNNQAQVIDDAKAGMNVLAIIGIVLICVGVFILIVVAVYTFLWKLKRKRRRKNHKKR